jgi:hypothetical protein
VIITEKITGSTEESSVVYKTRMSTSAVFLYGDAFEDSSVVKWDVVSVGEELLTFRTILVPST